MGKFTQHIPNFADGIEPATAEFTTTEDLVNLEVVQRYVDDRFSHFAMDDKMLLVIKDDGFYWWVVGYVESDTPIDLPEWDHGKYRVQLENGENVVMQGSEIMSSCGDVITLLDGSKAKWIRE